jgi:hypothetical protein
VIARLIAIVSATVSIAGCQPLSRPAPGIAPLAKFVPQFRFRGSARLGGTIGIHADCVVLIQNDGTWYVPIWPQAARLERDREGWLVRDGGSDEVVRPGDRVVGAGGVLIETNGVGWSRSRVDDVVEPDILARCGTGIASFHSFRRQNEQDGR